MKRYDPRLWIGGILIFVGALTLLDNLNIIAGVSAIFWGVIWGAVGGYFLYVLLKQREIWWAAIADTGQRTKSDLPLYPRRVGVTDSYEQVPFIECTSCHDPHVDRAVFLRTANEQGKLCMTCHVK